MKRNAILVVVALILSAGATLAQDSSGVRCVGRLDNSDFYDIVIAGDFAYISASTYGLKVVDVSDPTHPVEVGVFNRIGNQVSGTTIVGERIYIADIRTGLSVDDLSDPINLEEIGFCNMTGFAEEVEVSGPYAYVMVNNGIRVVDISDPAHPFEISSFIGNLAATGIALSGFYAWLMDYSVLRVVDISNPLLLEQVGDLHFQDGAADIKVVDSIAYIANVYDGLKILNVIDPTDPRVIGGCEVPDLAYGIAVSGPFAFVAAADSGLRVVNIAEPQHPFEIGFYKNQGEMRRVAVSNSFVFLIGSTGLSIYDCSEAMGVGPAGTPVLPKSFLLSAAFPNPFNSRTTVAFTLPRPGEVSFGLFDPLGRQVRRLVSSGWFPAGSHQLTLNADGLPSGDYLLRLHSGENVLQQRIVLVK